MTVVCKTCLFELWNPVYSLPASTLGLYNDSRFPGRSLLVFNSHEEHLEDLDSTQLGSFMKDVQYAVRILKKATGSKRVNVAILGNSEAHLHAHLIPRFPENEPLPHSSPWDDTRNKGRLSDAVIGELTGQLQALLIEEFEICTIGEENV